MASKIKKSRGPVKRVHITQDDYGFWMTSFEWTDGTLTVGSYGAEDSEHELHDAYHPEELGLPTDTVFVVSEPRIPLRIGEPGWKKPRPRLAREPHYMVQYGNRTTQPESG